MWLSILKPMETHRCMNITCRIFLKHTFLGCQFWFMDSCASLAITVERVCHTGVRIRHRMFLFDFNCLCLSVPWPLVLLMTKRFGCGWLFCSAPASLCCPHQRVLVSLPECLFLPSQQNPGSSGGQFSRPDVQTVFYSRSDLHRIRPMKQLNSNQWQAYTFKDDKWLSFVLQEVKLGHRSGRSIRYLCI